MKTEKKHRSHNLEWALELAGLGARIYPCLQNTEIPVYDDYEVIATIDSYKIESWWKENPEYEVGQIWPEGGMDEPLPLFPPPASPAPYPIEGLGCLSSVAESIQCRAQVPAAMAAQSVLSVAALAAQAFCDVVLPYGQTRPLSIYFASVAVSGDRKSTADNYASAGVADHEAKLREKHKRELDNWMFRHSMWLSDKKRIETDKRKSFDVRMAEIEALGPQPLKPLEPILTMGDITLDGLTKNWANAPASLAIFTAEGATFTNGHGMTEEARLRTAAALSEIWDGKPIKRVRAAEGVAILPGRRLSIHVMIQPGAAAKFLADPALRDQGLLSRMLMAAPATIAGLRLYREPTQSEQEAIDAFGEKIQEMLAQEASMVDGKRNELKPRALSFSVKAKKAWVAFYNRIEKEMSAGGAYHGMRDFASKSAEHVARVAGVLTVVKDLNATAIEPAEMDSAIKLVDWYLVEHLRMQTAGLTDPTLHCAAKLLEWLQAQKSDEVQFRDILQSGPGFSRTKAAAEELIRVLSNHRWIVEIAQRPRTFRVWRPERP